VRQGQLIGSGKGGKGMLRECLVCVSSHNLFGDNWILHIVGMGKFGI